MEQLLAQKLPARFPVLWLLSLRMIRVCICSLARIVLPATASNRIASASSPRRAILGGLSRDKPELVDQIRLDGIERLTAAHRDLPEGLAPLLRRLLAKRPQDRLDSAKHLVQALTGMA